ncbi:YeeE/YedE family protein [Emticicia sp. C21]|uniref:YeeE/YedE family protein n=1 Tax=Emticicia sp. C21 TaxID=2302915 RepID=UPI000E349FDE|nr:YeeE/YedE thiosulfate transporter family protein [Emticicia sp. C21]RFS16190.1 YeeE/YedE family protein [Emticicia sp. C21]
MLELLKQPWHWSVAGVIIGLFVPILLISGNKAFGISSSMRHICAAVFPAKIRYFKYDWKKETWNLVFVAGVIIGGWIGAHLLSNLEPIKIADSTKTYLQSIGIQEFGALVPTDLFSWESLFTLRGFIFIVVGGFLVGFGTRYAGGCTSGHSIMGLSNLQLPSLIATICFMVGGFLVTWLVIPYL